MCLPLRDRRERLCLPLRDRRERLCLPLRHRRERLCLPLRDRRERLCLPLRHFHFIVLYTLLPELYCTEYCVSQVFCKRFFRNHPILSVVLFCNM